MTRRAPIFLHNIELNGAITSVTVRRGALASIGDPAPSKDAQLIDGRGGALIPGLIDHHIHLYATAARLGSVELSACTTKDALLLRLRAASESAEPGAWIRATGYDDSGMGLLSRDDLDQLGAANPIRVQDRTGALWVLNGPALERAIGEAPPPCVERDEAGRATGRIWRGDSWLRERINSSPPSLAALSRTLASYGVTGVTDTGANNGPAEASLLASARARGELMQSLCLMSGTEIPPAPEYEIGPLKILPDERDLPELDEIVERMRLARTLKRAVAVHCVTAAELVLALAAFEAIGAQNGDRLEHGGIIPEAMFEQIRELDLTVVTQPHFIRDRGDRYLRDVDPSELPDLYRLNSLRAAGVKLAAGSDAPYGGFDPWRAIAAATDRKTKDGAILGTDERISARDALSLYLGAASNPGGGERRIAIGESADLCLLSTPLAQVLAAPESAHVAATIARGDLIHAAP